MQTFIKLKLRRACWISNGWRQQVADSTASQTLAPSWWDTWPPLMRYKKNCWPTAWKGKLRSLAQELIDFSQEGKSWRWVTPTSTTQWGRGILHVSPTFPPAAWKLITACTLRPAAWAFSKSSLYAEKSYCWGFSASTNPHHTSTMTPSTPARFRVCKATSNAFWRLMTAFCTNYSPQTLDLKRKVSSHKAAFVLAADEIIETLILKEPLLEFWRVWGRMECAWPRPCWTYA